MEWLYRRPVDVIRARCSIRGAKMHPLTLFPDPDGIARPERRERSALPSWAYGLSGVGSQSALNIAIDGGRCVTFFSDAKVFVAIVGGSVKSTTEIISVDAPSVPMVKSGERVIGSGKRALSLAGNSPPRAGSIGGNTSKGGGD